MNGAVRDPHRGPGGMVRDPLCSNRGPSPVHGGPEVAVRGGSEKCLLGDLPVDPPRHTFLTLPLSTTAKADDVHQGWGTCL